MRMTVGDNDSDTVALGLAVRWLVWQHFARDPASPYGARADFARYMDRLGDRILTMSGPLPDQRIRAMEVAQAISRLKDDLLGPSR